jgi:hypothetical protein
VKRKKAEIRELEKEYKESSLEREFADSQSCMARR